MVTLLVVTLRPCESLSESCCVSWIAPQSRLEATERRLEAMETAHTIAVRQITELTAEKVGRLVWFTACLHHLRVASGFAEGRIADHAHEMV